MAQTIGSLLLLGASGDLSGRLLLPAFGQLLDREESRQDVVLIGAGVEVALGVGLAPTVRVTGTATKGLKASLLPTHTSA